MMTLETKVLKPTCPSAGWYDQSADYLEWYSHQKGLCGPVPCQILGVHGSQ